MKTITIKEFQRNIYASIKELPCLITKDGKPFLKVEAYSAEHQVATIRPAQVATPTDNQFSDKALPGYKFNAMIGKYVKCL